MTNVDYSEWPDDRIDRAIAEMLGYTHVWPRWCANLDAALGLVADTIDFTLTRVSEAFGAAHGGGRWEASIPLPDRHPSGDEFVTAYHDNPARAVCVAVLKHEALRHESMST